MRVGDILSEATHDLCKAIDERDYGEAIPHIYRSIIHVALVGNARRAAPN
jgi:hypothetical protein